MVVGGVEQEFRMFGEFIERWEVMLLRVELVFWLLKLRGEKNEIRVEWSASLPYEN